MNRDWSTPSSDYNSLVNMAKETWKQLIQYHYFAKIAFILKYKVEI